MSGRIFIIALLLVNFVNATSIDVTVTCPDAFVGVVDKVTDPQAPFSSLAKQDVEFIVQEVIRGEIDRSISIKALKFGPNKFEVGQQYQIELRKKRICKVTKL